MITSSFVQAFLARRKPYPNAPWQRWLGLVQGGPARRQRARDDRSMVAWWFLCLVAYGAFLGVAVRWSLHRSNPSFEHLTGWMLAPGLGLLVGIGYGLLVLCSAGFLLSGQVKRLHAVLEQDPRLAHACVRWVQDDPLLRTRDLWRIRIARALFRLADKSRTAQQELATFMAQQVAWRGAPPPFPADLTPAERDRIQAKLPRLTQAAPIRTGGLGVLLALVRPLAFQGPTEVWVSTSAVSRFAALINVLVQLGVLAIWKWNWPTHGETPLNSMFSAWFGCLLFNALLLWPPRLRMRPRDDLVRLCLKDAEHSEWLVWALMQRCPDAETVSSRDLVAVLRSNRLFRGYNERKRAELVHAAYRERLASLPIIGAVKAEAEAEALDEDTAACATAAPPRRL